MAKMIIVIEAEISETGIATQLTSIRRQLKALLPTDADINVRIDGYEEVYLPMIDLVRNILINYNCATSYISFRMQHFADILATSSCNHVIHEDSKEYENYYYYHVLVMMTQGETKVLESAHPSLMSSTCKKLRNLAVEAVFGH